jgi:CheY-like chemotaxis protein
MSGYIFCPSCKTTVQTEQTVYLGAIQLSCRTCGYLVDDGGVGDPDAAHAEAEAKLPVEQFETGMLQPLPTELESLMGERDMRDLAPEPEGGELAFADSFADATHSSAGELSITGENTFAAPEEEAGTDSGPLLTPEPEEEEEEEELAPMELAPEDALDPSSAVTGEIEVGGLDAANAVTGEFDAQAALASGLASESAVTVEAEVETIDSRSKLSWAKPEPRSSGLAARIAAAEKGGASPPESPSEMVEASVSEESSLEAPPLAAEESPATPEESLSAEPTASEESSPAEPDAVLEASAAEIEATPAETEAGSAPIAETEAVSAAIEAAPAEVEAPPAELEAAAAEVEAPPAAAPEVPAPDSARAARIAAAVAAGRAGGISAAVSAGRAAAAARNAAAAPPPAAPISAEAPVAPASEGRSTQYGTILIAEDTELLRQILADSLVDAQIARQVTQSANGEECLESFTRMLRTGTPAELAILDLEMPGLSGLHAALAMRAVERGMGVNPVPIVFFTGRPSDERLIAAIDLCQPARYLHKGSESGSALRVAQRLLEVLKSF